MKPFYQDNQLTTYDGDALEVLTTFPEESIDCVVTSPPYFALRDYGVDGQLGLEPSIEEYIEKLCDVFDEIQRVLKEEGTCWVNLGDTHNSFQAAGDKKFGNEEFNKNRPSREQTNTPKKRMQKLPAKCLLQIPSRFSIEMTDRGWILRNIIIWHKPNCMPESAKDRFTVDFNPVFFFVKRKQYCFEQQFTKTTGNTHPGRKDGKLSPKRIATDSSWDRFNQTYIPTERNMRCVWTIPTQSFPEAHFATFPEQLVVPMINAGCPEGGTVLDPFCGSGTTLLVAEKLGRKAIGIDLKKEYCEMALKRCNQRTFESA